MYRQASNSAVLAGLAASLGLTAALVGLPVVASAGEVGFSLEATVPVLEVDEVEEGQDAELKSSLSGGTMSFEPEGVENPVGSDEEDGLALPEGSNVAPVTEGTSLPDGGPAGSGIVEDSSAVGSPEGDEGVSQGAAGTEASDDEVAEGEPSEDSSLSGDPSLDDAVPEDAEKPADEGIVLESSPSNAWVERDDGSYQWYDQSGQAMKGGWVVTDKNLDNSAGELQRYWIDKDTGSLVFSKLINVIENGLNYWAYATDSGFVARGKYSVTDESGAELVYLADNDGKLANPGWVVSSAYGDGLQRYWIDDKTHSAVVGYSSDGYEHYTTKEGYVLRGSLSVKKGEKDLVYLADNDGRLARSGWVVSDAYGSGLQRYWVDAEERAAVVGYSQDGWDHYTTSAGYVLRGALTDSSGVKHWANNDGLLVTGWIVTGDFTGGTLQRYWQEAGEIVTDRLINADGWWAYATSNGEVLRGAGVVDGKVLLANNDGRLRSGSGWLVTGEYSSTLQRYYLVPVEGAGYSYAQTGFFQADLAGYEDAWFYGDLTHGYVARGKTSTPNGLVLSNNEGILAETLTDMCEGMVVTGEFDNGELHRYYFVNVDGHIVAKTGVFVLDGNHYFGLPDEGYLAVGRQMYGKGMIVATSEGVLLWQDKEGWLVTDAFDGDVQRYYFIDLGDGVMGARIGLFKLGNDEYYGREDTGYVVRGSAGYVAPDGRIYYADNDGKLSFPFLTSAGWSAWERIKGLYSWTQYLLAVDCSANRTVVFQGSYITSKGCYGNWSPIYDWSCSTGNPIYNGGQGTLKGTFTIAGDDADYNWNPVSYRPGGYRTVYWTANDVRYFTGFVCNLGFHSTIGYSGGYSDPGQLGRNITHGCIRLLEANAKWIYDNALPGTKVVVF